MERNRQRKQWRTNFFIGAVDHIENTFYHFLIHYNMPHGDNVNLIINGKDKIVSENLSVETLLKELSVNPKTVVVERNGEILNKESYPEIQLLEGDVIEIIRFMGGG